MGRKEIREGKTKYSSVCVLWCCWSVTNPIWNIDWRHFLSRITNTGKPGCPDHSSHRLEDYAYEFAAVIWCYDKMARVLELFLFSLLYFICFNLFKTAFYKIVRKNLCIIHNNLLLEALFNKLESVNFTTHCTYLSKKIVGKARDWHKQRQTAWNSAILYGWTLASFVRSSMVPNEQKCAIAIKWPLWIAKIE